MEDKTVPWWRKVLNFALSGLRSGFGLFARSQKSEAADAPEIVAGREEDREEETQLTEHSPKLEPIAEAAHEVEAIAVPEAVTVPEAAVAAEPEAHAQPEEATVPMPEPAIAESAPLLRHPEPVAEPASEAETQDEAVLEASAAQVPAESSSELKHEAEAATAVKPAVEVAPEVIAEEAGTQIESHQEAGGVAETAAVSEQAPPAAEETSAAVAEVITEEAPSEPAAAPEFIVAPEIPAEPAAEEITPVEVAPVPEIGPEHLPATTEVAVNVEAPADPAADGIEAAETVADQDAAPVVEVVTEPEIEAVAEAEAVSETKAIAEPEDVAEADAIVDTEVEVVAEPQQTEEPSTAVRPTEEIAAANNLAPESARSEELIGTATEEADESTVVQPAVNERESTDTAASSAEAAVADHPGDETSVQPMELNESIPEETAEPEWAGEAVPVPEGVAGETSGSNEPAPEAVAEPLPDATAEPEPEAVTESVPEAIATPESEAVAEPEIPPGEPAQETTEPAAQAEEQPQTPVDTGAETPSEKQSEEPAPAPPPPPKPFIKLESRDNPADLSPFSVIVSQVYDGPLDLLLDLIRKQDIDIYDIPIARITAQFLSYVNQLKSTDVDVAGEFIYTASLLIHIKSKMLLPRAPSGPDEAAEDPRRELVERLLEHERFKNAAQMLQQKQMLEAATWTNPGIHEFRDDATAEPEIAADTVDLVRVFRDILDRARNRPVINLQEDSVTVGQMIQFLSRRLTMEDKPVALHRLLSHTQSERALIAMFLALLELVRLQAILLRQDRAFSEIFIKKHTGFEALMNDGLANSTDEWR